jgi:hypothetical protein
MMKRVLLLIVFIGSLNADALGQLMIRESFAAATQAQKPASFLWTIEKAPDNIGFGTIDIGVRYAIDRGEFIAGPTIEYHKLSRESNEYDRYSIGGSGELLLPFFEIPWLGSPYLTGHIAYENNRINNVDGLALSLSGTFFSRSAAAPGSQNKLWENSVFRYYPHIGVEKHPAVSDIISAVTLGFVQLNFELWPWIGRIQILGNYTIVKNFNAESLHDDLNRSSLSINLFLDPEERFGFGAEYLNSASPRDGFKKVRRTVIGFKVKL